MDISSVPTLLKAGAVSRVSVSPSYDPRDPTETTTSTPEPTITIEYRDSNGVITSRVAAAACVDDGSGLWHYDFQSAETDVPGLYWVRSESTVVTTVKRRTVIGAIQIVPADA